MSEPDEADLEFSFNWTRWRESGAPIPITWHAVRDESGSDTGNCWTISPVKDLPGWETDMGYSGYGFPREVAEAIAARLNGVSS